jgi:hypothetical protein
MKNIVYKLILTTGLVFGLISFNANAGLIGTSAGTWSNPITGDLATAGTIMGEDTMKISWGKSAGYGQSSWTFYGRDNIDVLTNGDWFKIGLFKHKNNPIYKYNFLGADLDLDLSIGGDLWSLSYGFDHWETLNYSKTCESPSGNKPCADRVTIPTVAATDTITIGGMVYEMTIKGFTRSDGYTNTIWTDEKDKSYAKLYASLSKVPEPSIIALFGIGLLGLGFATRRKTHG